MAGARRLPLNDAAMAELRGMLRGSALFAIWVGAQRDPRGEKRRPVLRHEAGSVYG